MSARMIIFRDGEWRELRLRTYRDVLYNAVINRIGRTDRREISHTNTFTLPNVQDNINALGINLFNKKELAKALNTKYPAKYYIDDKLLQQGYLVINNTREGEIHANFIDEALDITEKWGSITYKELLISSELTRPADYQAAIDEMTDYDMSKTEVLQELSLVGVRGHKLASFPHNLNVIGTKFQKPDTAVADERLDDSFNPYQSRPIFNAKAVFDLAVETYGFRAIYDSSVDWSILEKTYIIEHGLEKSQVEGSGQLSITYPSALNSPHHWSLSGSGVTYRDTVFTYTLNSSNTTKPEDFPDWINPSTFHEENTGGFTDFLDKSCIFIPNLEFAAVGTLKWTADLAPLPGGGVSFSIYSLWENITPGSGIVSRALPHLEDETTNFKIDVTIDKAELLIPPAGAGEFIGVIAQAETLYYGAPLISTVLSNQVIKEEHLPEGVITYDKYGQYISNIINLTHAAPEETVKTLISAIMHKEGILMSIDGRAKTVKFFTYGAYLDKKNAGDFYNWSEYLREYSPLDFNTDYGNEYARRNRIGLKDPYIGNTFDIELKNQGAESKYRDYTENYVKKFRDISQILKVNNTTIPYLEFTNKGLGMVEKTGNIADGLHQVRADGVTQGDITGLDAFQNVNYLNLPAGVGQWYNLVDEAVKGEAVFLLPVDIISNLDLSKPVYIEGMGGFFIIEEVSQYLNPQTTVRVKLIKLIDNIKDSNNPITPDIRLAGSYTGESIYSATLEKISGSEFMEGSYEGESIYSATMEKDIVAEDLGGDYEGESIYSATLSKNPSIFKDMEGSYEAESIYSAQLIRGTTAYVDKPNDFSVRQRFNAGIALDGNSVNWNATDHTIDIVTGKGVTIQVGQEVVVHVHNNSGATMYNGKVVYPIGTSTNGLPNIGYSIANSHETIENQVGILTADILDGGDGFVTLIGQVRDIDTSGLSEGPVYISATVAGELTSVRPLFPDYAILMGVVLIVDDTVGTIVTDIRDNLSDSLVNFWNGTIRESFKCEIKSDDGITSYLELSPRNGHPNLTAMLSDGLHTITATPPVYINLTSGTDTVPQMNYVYYLQSTKSLVVSTSAFPIAEHIRIGTFALQTASKVQGGDGVQQAQVYNDHLMNGNGQGHLSHITSKLRGFGTSWISGVDLTPTAVGASSLISTTGGIVSQLHEQAFSAFDLATGDHIHIINHDITPFLEVSNLNVLDDDAQGNSLSNSSFSIVFWGSMNSDPTPSKLYGNLPDGVYGKNNPDLAISDAYNYSNYIIPNDYRRTGFLIARVTYVRQAGGDWSVYNIQDLRTTSGGVGGGVGGGGQITAFTSLIDTINDYTGLGGEMLVVGDGEAGVETIPRTYEHEQVTASSTWIITHPLKKKPSIVTTTVGGQRIFGEEIYNSISQVTINWGSPVAGFAELN